MGYSRAVRVGPLVYVSGTTATGQEENIVGANDSYAQAKQALGNLEAALRGVRARLSHEDLHDEYRSLGGGRAHGEMFGEVRPTTSMIEVQRLISPEMLVEIKADAVVGEYTLGS